MCGQRLFTTMKRVLLTISAALVVLGASAQNQSMAEFRKKAMQEFRSFSKQAKSDYNEFRKKANAEYAEFLKEAWKDGQMEPAVAPPKIDPPVQPEVPPRVSDTPIAPKPLQFGNLSPMPKPTTPKLPRLEVPTVPPEEEPLILKMPVQFYGETVKIRLRPGTGEVQLADASEATVSNAWKLLSDGRFELMLADCIATRDKLHLCDWGYYLLTKTVAEEYCEAKNTNNSKMLQAYLLTQAGYKIRLARSNNSIYIMLPSELQIYNTPFFKMNDASYYIIDKSFTGPSIQVCQAAFPGEQGFSMSMPEQPQFPFVASNQRAYKSVKYPDLALQMSVNKNLMDFLNNYPRVSWEIHSYASLSPQTKQALYPVLKKAIDGKNEAQAANILINFVQTGFNYKTDPEQFGYERPLFGDETFFYPYSDCEDRAILYSILVRDLMGLKVALVNYPNHLATAVCFKENAYGDYFNVSGNKYTICDPTYIGANIGMTMPDMDNNKAQLIILQ